MGATSRQAHDLDVAELLPFRPQDLFYLADFFYTGSHRIHALPGLEGTAYDDPDEAVVAMLGLYLRGKSASMTVSNDHVHEFLRRHETAGLRTLLTTPSLKYSLWVQLFPEPWWTFLNYGFRDRLAPPPQKDNNPFDLCAQLYDALIGDVRLDGRRVLEVGSGRGGGVRRMAECFGAGEVVGLDATLSHIEFCRRVHEHDRIRFEHGYAEALPFGERDFDVVVNLESCGYYRPFSAFVQGAWRVLRPCGYLLIGIHGHLEAMNGYLQEAVQAGFVVEEIRDISANVDAAMRTFDFRALVRSRVPPDRTELMLDGLQSLWDVRFLGRGTRRYYRFILQRTS